MSDLFSYSWHPQHLSPHRRQWVLACQHGDARLGMPVPSSSSPIAFLIYIRKISSIWCLIPQRFGAVSEILSHCLNQPLCVSPACEYRSNLILSRQESQVHSVWRDKEGRGLWVQDQGQCPQVHQACGKCSGPLSAGSWFHCWEIRIWVDTQTIWTLIRDPRRGTLYSGFSGKRTGNLMVLEAGGRRWEKYYLSPQHQAPCRIFLFYLMSSHPSPMM